MRTTKSKKPITVASVCIAAVACAVGAYRFVYLPLRPADVSHARISINATGKFDESQIDGAVKADLARLKSWNGCRVDAVRYDAKRSATLLAAEHDVTASGGSSSISTAIDEYGMDNVIYLSMTSLAVRARRTRPKMAGEAGTRGIPVPRGRNTDGSSSTRDIKVQRNTVHHAMMSKPYDDDWL